MAQAIHTIGIIGAGKVGIVLAQLAHKAGYDVMIAGSGNPKKIALSVSVLVPRARVATTKEVVKQSDCIILAIPLGKYHTLPSIDLKDKLVIDAMNYWWEVDGDRPELKDPCISTSELVQQHLATARVVKAFNHIGYHDLHDETKPPGAANRKAIAIAGNEETDVASVSAIVDAFGFDPVPIGTLADGIKLQPGSHVFGAHVGTDELEKLILDFYTSDWGREVQTITTE